MTIDITPMTDDHYEVVSPWFNASVNHVWLESVYRLGKYNRAIHRLSINRKDNRLYVVTCDDAEVGIVGLSEIDTLDRHAMVWYLCGNKDYAGKGVVTQAVQLALDEAFGPLRLHSVHARVAASNAASIRVLEKNDFKRIGQFRECHLVDGKLHDRLLFEILEDEHVRDAA